MQLLSGTLSANMNVNLDLNHFDEYNNSDNMQLLSDSLSVNANVDLNHFDKYNNSYNMQLPSSVDDSDENNQYNFEFSSLSPDISRTE